MKFEYPDEITSDQMFRAYGQTLPEVFRYSAMAMFGVMYDLEGIKQEAQVTVTAKGSDEENLLYDWLSNLLIEFEVEGIFFVDFSVDTIEKGAKNQLRLQGTASGSKVIPEIRTHVKGVTFHKFSLERVNNQYVATVVVDV